MKKFFSTILLTVFTLNFCSITNASYRTPTIPTNQIKIYTKEQLKEFATAVNTGFNTQNTQVTLESDLIITEEDNWIPIGSTINPFIGHFDGQLHKIKLYIEKPSNDNVGLFGVAKDATFKNLTIEGLITGNNQVGGFVGSGENLTFENCYTKSCQVYGQLYVASFLGYGYGTFSNCYSNSSIMNNFYKGGFIGYSTKKSTFKNCTNYCTIRVYTGTYLDFCSNEHIVDLIDCYKGDRQISQHNLH